MKSHGFRSRLQAGFWVALLSCGVAGSAAAGDARLGVAARILKQARLNVASQPPVLEITESDVARGYIVVPDGAEIVIQSNSPDGYALEVSAEGEFLRQVSVMGLGSELSLGPTGSVFLQKGSGSGVTRSTVRLGFRFTLAALARAGTYAWPVRLSVVPL